MEIKKNKAGVVASVVITGLTASILGSGACLQTIPVNTTPARDRLTCEVVCTGTYVAVGAEGTSGQGQPFRMAFSGEAVTWQSCGTGVTMDRASAFCANTMHSSSCLGIGLANSLHGRAQAAAGRRLTSGSVENLSCTTTAARVTAGGCAPGVDAFCNHFGGAGKADEAPEEQSSWDIGMPAYTPSGMPAAAIGHVLPQTVKVSINNVEASPVLEGELQLTSVCTNCSSHLTGLSLTAAPFMWGVVQVSDLRLHSWDGIPVSIDANGDFTVDASQHPLAVSLSTPLGLSYGSLPASQIVGHIDTGARTITLDLRNAHVPMQQATVSFYSVIRASY